MSSPEPPSGSDAPGSDSPRSDAPAGDAPGSATPGGDAPGGDAPGGEVPADLSARPARGSSPGEPVARDARRRDRVAGFAIIVAAFLASLFISWKASQSVKPRVAAEPGPPTSEGLVGYPERVDPLATLELARALTERDQLRRIVASGVASDGTVDVKRARASIRYDFDSARGEGPEPPRPAGTPRRGDHCGRQSIHVRSNGIYAARDRPSSPCSTSRGEPLPEPRCTPRQIWQVAIERGARADGRATIDYFRAQGGPAWRFSLQGSRVRFTLFGDCKTELEGKAARPLIP